MVRSDLYRELAPMAVFHYSRQVDMPPGRRSTGDILYVAIQLPIPASQALSKHHLAADPRTASLALGKLTHFQHGQYTPGAPQMFLKIWTDSGKFHGRKFVLDASAHSPRHRRRIQYPGDVRQFGRFGKSGRNRH